MKEENKNELSNIKEVDKIIDKILAEEEQVRSECCGEKMIDDCDLCPECGEHT